ncbi:MAG: DUF4124 domain-containing protein [Burkholderiaceae bacterium]
MLLISSAASAQVYKCHVDGKTVYTDAPCDVGSQQVKKIDVPPSDPEGETVARLELAAQKRRLQMREAIQAGVPMVSMTQSELAEALGAPNRINTGDYASGSHDQLIYDRGDRTWYVYVTNGVVSSVQNTERIGSRHWQRAPCPTAIDIRNMEFDATKFGVQNTPEGRALRRKIQEAKNCQ